VNAKQRAASLAALTRFWETLCREYQRPPAVWDFALLGLSFLLGVALAALWVR
jgi:hypothetical protein